MINFKTDKEPKMKLFDFWAFQNFTQILSHDKIIFHMLFGAIQITSRKSLNLKWKKNNFESWFDHIGEAQMFEIGRTFLLLPPVWSKNTQKNIQFSEGGQSPLKVIILPNDFYHVISHPENPPETSFERFF